MPRHLLPSQSPRGQLPGRHRARFQRAEFRRRFRRGISHRVRRAVYGRSLLCLSMRGCDIVALAAVLTAITAIWLVVTAA